jgi:hypothetical protein
MPSGEQDLQDVQRAAGTVPGNDSEERPPAGKVLLGAWRTNWVAYQLDRPSGRYTRRLVRLGEVLPLSGFGAVERTREQGKLFFALFRWGGHVVFQAGRQHWRLDDSELRLTYRLLDDRRSSAFTVSRGQKPLFQCTYGHAFRALFGRAPRETAADTVDYETDHFLAHVAGLPLPFTDPGTWVDGQAVPINWRAQVRSQLALLGDADRQREYERELKIADVPGELFSAWFADSYAPERPAFRSAFDPAELELLKHFTALVDAARNKLGDVRDLAELQARPEWMCVVEEAARLLARLPESKDRRAG